MENTLLVGDHVLVDRLQFAPKDSLLGSLLPYRDIRRGDIVVFVSPQTRGLYVVKRIIGIPGDRIHLSDGIVYRNGEKLDEPYVLHDADNRLTIIGTIFQRLGRLTSMTCSRFGRRNYPCTFKGRILLFRQMLTLAWAIIEVSALTAAIGDSFLSKM